MLVLEIVFRPILGLIALPFVLLFTFVDSCYQRINEDEEIVVMTPFVGTKRIKRRDLYKEQSAPSSILTSDVLRPRQSFGSGGSFGRN